MTNYYSGYGHVANYGNDDDGAYDSAYDFSNHHLDNSKPDPYPEPYTRYNEDLMRRAVEYRVTPQELLKADEHCLRKQNEWLKTTYRTDRKDQSGMETRDERGEEVVETTVTKFFKFSGYSGYGGMLYPSYHKPMQGMYDVNDVSNTPPTSNKCACKVSKRTYVLNDVLNMSLMSNEHDTEVKGHRFMSSKNLAVEQQDRYVQDLVRKATEYGMTPEALHKLNEGCLREQQEWLAEEARTNEQSNEELGEHIRHEEEVYEGCRMADESPNLPRHSTMNVQSTLQQPTQSTTTRCTHMHPCTPYTLPLNARSTTPCHSRTRMSPYGTKGGQQTKHGLMPTGHGQIHKKKWVSVGV